MSDKVQFTLDGQSVEADAGQKAIDWIQSIVAEPEVGTIYTGKVVKIVDFGAFVNFLGSKDGLVHISELANERVPSVGDVISEGQEVKVLVLAEIADLTANLKEKRQGFIKNMLLNWLKMDLHIMLSILQKN